MDQVQDKNLTQVKMAKTPLKGVIVIPADKSISHRAAIFGTLTEATVSVNNFSRGADCKSTVSVLEKLGVKISYPSKKNLVISNENRFREPANILDAGNSGTTMRLMTGVLSGLDFYSVLTGDNSLINRPMARIINPLKEMGANIWAKDNNTKAPLSIKGARLSGISYKSSIASAQVKSAILLAGLHAEGITSIVEPFKSRDHTERLLKYLDADISVNGNEVIIKKSALTPKNITIPGDISSAAFFMAAGVIVPDSEIVIQNIGLNPTRTGIIDILRNMGAEIKILNERLECEEEIGDIKVNYSNLKGVTIDSDQIPRVIDELPIIAVVATQAEGATVIRGAEDLRNKESDRIKAICSELGKLGAEIKETQDGFVIQGKTKLKGNCILESHHDHRIAMSAYVAGLITDTPVQISNFDWVNISFPEFRQIFDTLTVN